MNALLKLIAVVIFLVSIVSLLAACAPKPQLIPDHSNPLPAIDSFDGALPGQTGSPWHLAGIDGAGQFYAGQAGHAAGWLVNDSQLILEVFHDQSFDDEKSNDGKGRPAPSRYNNVFLVGFRGFSPTQTQDIVIEARMKLSCDQGFWGSGGVWVEEENTFDQEGMGLKPFHAFGFSYLGRSAEGISGLQFEAVDMT
jgi:hypothetical protein